jgi:hypothetical protein
MIEGDTADPELVMRACVDASGGVTTPGDEDES